MTRIITIPYYIDLVIRHIVGLNPIGMEVYISYIMNKGMIK